MLHAAVRLAERVGGPGVLAGYRAGVGTLARHAAPRTGHQDRTRGCAAASRSVSTATWCTWSTRLLGLVVQVRQQALGVRPDAARSLRVLVLAIVAGTGVALRLALRDAVGDQGPDGLDWLPLIGRRSTTWCFWAIAVFFLYSFPDGCNAATCSRCCTGCGRSPHIIDVHPADQDPSTCGGLLPDRREAPTTTSTATRWAVPQLLLGAAQPGRQDRRLVRRESRDAVVLDTSAPSRSSPSGCRARSGRRSRS